MISHSNLNWINDVGTMVKRLIILIGLLFFAVSPALAGKRIALVIGNNQYANMSAEHQLQKAVNDARAMRDTLRDYLGFTVLYGENADWQAMNGLIKQLEAQVSDGDIVFFYYSGHGASIGGENYILPTDVPALREGEEGRLTGNSFGAEALTKAIQKQGARAIFAVLDACRNNPFAAEGEKSAGGIGGLSSIDAAEGVFTLYAAGLGQTALDRLSDSDTDPNSIFTRNLIPLLKTNGLSQVDLAKKVQQQVTTLAASVGHKQKPAYYDQITGFVTLRDGDAPQLPELQQPDISAATQEWALLSSGTDVAALKAFQEKYKDDPEYGKLVEQRLALAGVELPPLSELLAGACKTLIASVNGVDTCLDPGADFTDCDECPHMIVIPEGTFTMGSADDAKDHESDESPQHAVTFDKAFSVGKFEVTRGQYAKFVADSGYAVGPSCSIDVDNKFTDTPGKSFKNPDFAQTDEDPVVCVSWDDAKAYTGWLSQQTGQQYRLLTEAEWEYVARAGAGTKFVSMAEGLGPSKATANFDSQATTPVGSLGGNDFGLFDMIGNATEWTNDCYLDRYGNGPASPDVSCDAKGDLRVNRGGAYYNTDPKYLRIAYRGNNEHESRLNYLGFRIARDFR